jgi:hypothetical protein
LWYQIAPPAGEFRWVKRDDLLLPDPRTNLLAGDAFATAPGEAQQPTPARPNAVQLAQATDILDDPFPDDPRIINGPALRHTASRDSSFRGTEPDNSGWRRARVPLRISQTESIRPDVNPRDLTTVGSLGSSGDAFGGASGLADSSRMNFASTSSDVPEDVANARLSPTFGSETMTDRLQRLDLELASEIIKPAETWQLNAFADRLLRIQESAETPAESQQARRLIEKVDRLRATQTRLIETNVGTRRHNLVDRSAAIGSGVNSEVQFGTTYDAYGWLGQLTRKSGKVEPGYVLQDDQGKIICLIEPSPGLNLHRYLNTKVGVVGTRGFNQQLKVNHITVDRVVVLENTQTKRR